MDEGQGHEWTTMDLMDNNGMDEAPCGNRPFVFMVSLSIQKSSPQKS